MVIIGTPKCWATVARVRLWLAWQARTKKETLRLLKRVIVREVFRLLTRPAPVDDYRDLRGSLRDFIRPHPT